LPPLGEDTLSFRRAILLSVSCPTGRGIPLAFRGVNLTQESTLGHSDSIHPSWYACILRWRDIIIVNWGFFLLRVAIGLGILGLLFFSQRFWYRAFWRVTSHWGRNSLRSGLRLTYVALLLWMIVTMARSVVLGRTALTRQTSFITVVTGLWFFSALFGYLSVKTVHGLERIWRWLHATTAKRVRATLESTGQPAAVQESAETVPDPGRRYFFRAATAAAGAAPFLTAMYGFAAERLNYQVHRIEIPIPKLPAALDGMKIVQLSDIHLSGYMSRSQVRRAVDMANDLGADLAVVTGDLITGPGDPIGDCVDEIRHLRAPLGVWGCNGNHEIYARAEDEAGYLYSQAGMKLLRQESVQLTFNAAQFNLIGVDYQREYSGRGQRQQLLADVEPLVRRDMPNILLSHNPNSFNRAAELGIELSLAGHTHGGQIQVEILDHRLSPARFISDYIAGLYQRPLFAPAVNERAASNRSSSRKLATSLFPTQSSAMAHIYVNRGLGTVGAPVRLGVPPEISLIVLRSA
jgi:predicted MPP superfamily phosphohydrolase